MKQRWLLGILWLLVGCGHPSQSDAQAHLKIAASSVPHAEILRFIAPKLKDAGIKLDVIEVGDYMLPNRLLAEGEVDANFFQHLPFLQAQLQACHYALTVLTPVHIERLGLYSCSMPPGMPPPAGGCIAIPCDPSNGDRALRLLAQQRWITLTDRAMVTALDIVDNPYHLRIEEMDSALLPRILPDVSCCVIPANVALESHLDQALYLEEPDAKYANIVAVRVGEERPELLVLKRELTSNSTAQFLEERYRGYLVPWVLMPTETIQ